MSGSQTTLRLDRLLSNLGYGTRKEILWLAKQGQIQLAGEAISEVSIKVALNSETSNTLKVSGEPLDPLPGLAIAMNKPVGVTCSHKEAGTLVYDLLPDRWRRRKPVISTVGRLDKDTSGLLLLTDDGGLLHRIISPKNKVAKTYRAILARTLSGNEAEVFASGELMLDGETKPLLPAELSFAGQDDGGRPVVYVTVHEGRYHQVRRMFAALGNHVEALHRERIGGFVLTDGLATGEYRLLAEQDIAQIFS